MQDHNNNPARHDGLIWALFISFVAVLGFVAIIAVRDSEIVYDTPQVQYTAGARNTVAEDVEVVIVPLEE